MSFKFFRWPIKFESDGFVQWLKENSLILNEYQALKKQAQQPGLYFREAAKEVLLLMAGPLRGGGGNGPAIKEMRTFLKFCYHLKIKIILL